MNLEQAIKIAQPYSKCVYERLRVLGMALYDIDTNKTEGDVVECGVWKGGVVILARLLAPRRKIWLYDTFNGMANRSIFDTKIGKTYYMPEGKAAVSLDEVTENLKRVGVFDSEHIRFVPGPVETTLTFENCLPEKIALLHLDTDWYYSTKIELEVLWPRVTKKGFMMVDDFGHWLGSRKAVEEFFPPLKRNMIHIDKTAIMMVK